ncbi:embigin [Centroberyx affinis]|uniref:embigin n=1 Tax=Centroberyx affinis TaxID=166261 RepID=UPI003A5BE500
MSASFHFLLLLLSCRGINTKDPDPTPPPLVPTTSLPSDVKSVVLKGESHVEKVELLKPVNLALECTWTGNQNKLPNITGYWRKDGDEIENSRLTVQLENGQYNLKREFRIVDEESLGNYSCVFDSEAEIHFILAVPQMGEERDKPIVSYVGDSVVIACKMEETKPQPRTWQWYKANGTDKEPINADAEPLRYEVKNEAGTAGKAGKTMLTVHKLTEADSGSYYCGAVYDIGISMSHVELRVITFLQPLKPFLAIVVEVLVLVAVILLYERSSSKKKSTAGDGMNADQANKLTQGENNGMEGSSTMRQRKV